MRHSTFVSCIYYSYNSRIHSRNYTSRTVFYAQCGKKMTKGLYRVTRVFWYELKIEVDYCKWYIYGHRTHRKLPSFPRRTHPYRIHDTHEHAHTRTHTHIHLRCTQYDTATHGAIAPTVRVCFKDLHSPIQVDGLPAGATKDGEIRSTPRGDDAAPDKSTVRGHRGTFPASAAAARQRTLDNGLHTYKWWYTLDVGTCDPHALFTANFREKRWCSIEAARPAQQRQFQLRLRLQATAIMRFARLKTSVFRSFAPARRCKRDWQRRGEGGCALQASYSAGHTVAITLAVARSAGESVFCFFFSLLFV